MSSDVVRALEPVVTALEKLGIAYRVGGSVASSALGVPRSTLDVDIVCELAEQQIDLFTRQLEKDFYVDADMIHDAVRRLSSFNVVHLETRGATAHLFSAHIRFPARATPRSRNRAVAVVKDRPMRIRYAAKTDPGLKRNHNEDYFSFIEDEQLFLVADGMGGHACGEVASKMAGDVIREFFNRSKDNDATWPFKMDRQLSYLENRLVVGIKMANQRIFEAAGKDLRLKGMGTTVVLGQVAGEKLYIAHVGDSRCYRIRAAVAQQMTRDHSLLEDYKDARPDMSDEEQKKFPHKNVITRALGMRESVQVDVSAEDIQNGDIFVLCSDGLSGMVDDKTMGELLGKEGTDLEQAVAGLVAAANQAGGNDNVTVLALECRAA